MSSILVGVNGCIFSSFCGGAEALEGGCHMTFLCGNCVGVIF